MQSFLRKIGLFFSLPLLCFLVLEWQMRVTPNSYTMKMDNFHQKKSKIESLILGNSHAYYGLNPEHFSSNTYNLANLSQSLDIDKILLEHDIDKMPELTRIILPISTFSLNFRIEDSEESWRKYDYLFYAGLNPEQLNISSYDLNSIIMVLGKGVSSCMKIMLKILKGEDLSYCSDTGWANNYIGSNPQTIKSNAENTAKRHNSFNYSFNENEESLESIIEIGKKHGVAVTFINLPVSESYFNHVDKGKWKEVVQLLKSLEKKHDNVHYLNWIQQDGFGIEFFHDPDHLNHAGAKKVSKLLDDYLKHKND